MASITKIFTPKGIPPIGPYSQAIKANGFVFLSGQLPAVSSNQKLEMIQGSVAEKTHVMCQNARAVLEAAGSSLDKVIKTSIFLVNLDDFGEMNEVYGKYFTGSPARSTIETSRLPAGASMEMEVIALE
ncbi:hypothetical protein N7450_010323 [Penicillium hetheringtonii]|uniref:Uncharacterized protein n=1 Tax=Penicillium hetheringtonii TaxID=911720 RepID=A0AAD6DD06_9EURO|nr:hypothetical protein N7450_010323 [Penicillium hetheringtonii]